jgi:CRP-like cAMP-binding protein
MARSHNKLIDALPPADREALLAVCRRSELEAGQSLFMPGRRISRVYFPTSACVSVRSQQPLSGEVMVVGFEGALGAQVVLGPDVASLPSIVQAHGEAIGVASDDFLVQVDHSGPLRNIVSAYVGMMIQQLALSSGCEHAHMINARLARRLLMTHDRARRAGFHVTHEFLAHVLGVRRVGITNAASELQRQGYITYARGEVSVLDRAGLESAACTCYAASRRAYSIAMRRAAAG